MIKFERSSSKKTTDLTKGHIVDLDHGHLEITSIGETEDGYTTISGTFYRYDVQKQDWLPSQGTVTRRFSVRMTYATYTKKTS